MPIEVVLRMDHASQKAVQRKLRSVGRRFTDMRPPNRLVGIWLHRWVNENFKGEGSKVGGWEPFKYGGRPSSKDKGNAQAIATHRYVNTNAKLLQDTGRLRASFDTKATRSDVTIGSDLKYSLYHNQGLPARNLPARRMLPGYQDEDVAQAILKIYNYHVQKVIRR